ncbi:methyltransferase family protein [Stieleria varia]|uniref:Isoprenylcysteine carboxyl methyltransferase (ICMT) family protein n=1 Tax=Stieleria varia TaxID=2528005 RepID=A0A5C6AVI1_9BACT|nr:methyltransferase [Stieleria varia]TWU02134.1 hypothetical protein Pla52n_31830 [Stieleria varia]
MLVLAQFVLSAVIVLSADWRHPDPIALGLSLPGALIAIAAWWAIGWSRIRIQPSPTQRTVLTTHGPYRWIRHPMYTGLLLFTAALLLSPLSVWRTVLWLVLLGVLIAKLLHEEAMLRKHFEAYSSYQQSTYRLLPLVW